MATTGHTDWTCDYPLCAGSGQTNDSSPTAGWVRVGNYIVCPLQNALTFTVIKATLGLA